jgi:hypothetical protein
LSLLNRHSRLEVIERQCRFHPCTALPINAKSRLNIFVVLSSTRIFAIRALARGLTAHIAGPTFIILEVSLRRTTLLVTAGCSEYAANNR